MLEIVMYIFGTLLILWAITVIGMIPYFKYDKFVWFYHDILGWHTPGNHSTWGDGCSLHSKCKHCHKNIMQDSQGNWFTYRKE